MNAETPGRALAVAALVALACSAMVSGAVYLLRPLQADSALLARNRVILEAAGRLPASGEDADIPNLFRQLDARVVDIASGTYASGVNAYSFDHWAMPADSADADPAEAQQVPVYLVREEGSLQRVVLPVHGPGMWSTIYGYVALESDLRTVAAIVFLRHGETPGIGDRIEEPQWRAKWRGKRLYDDKGEFALAVVEGADGQYEVDLISGASITCDAIGELVAAWFGTDGYAPFLERLRRTGGS